MREHFCMCDDTGCALHPSNHDKGCDPCVKSNLKKGEIPSCFFRRVHDDINGVEDFSIEGFVEFYVRHRGDEAENEDA